MGRCGGEDVRRKGASSRGRIRSTLGRLQGCGTGTHLYSISGSFLSNFIRFVGKRGTEHAGIPFTGGAVSGCLKIVVATLGVTISSSILSMGPKLTVSEGTVYNRRAPHRCLAVSRIHGLVRTSTPETSIGVTFLFSYFYKLQLDSIHTLR